ncbi:amino acid/amide ABC transporter substrate-binding protein, HAAT family [Ruegeria marina]|uniref:Amino acid/amide ABC transporter substrate-binding protein, HAAT family n=2 Tax=Ruegeria marina TaxID=639004 RepID=A0A1G7DDH2_9RHOB|nr:amino acid/amide ABC transporter substrate-binding protein, HAAT family [Ruegeria marina]
MQCANSLSAWRGVIDMNRFAAELFVPTELAELRDGPMAASRSSYRIALLIPLCGAAGLWAPSCISSAQAAVEELNRGHGLNGRKVQLIMIDAAQESSLPIEETVNDLIESRSIDAIVGMHISAIRQRLSKVVRQRIPYIYTPLYEGGETTAGLFAIGETPDEQLGPSMELMQSQYRPKSWALIGNDYVWPRMSHLNAKAKLKQLAVNLAYEKYLPFGLSNMARHVDDIAMSGAEAVLISLVGQDAVAFNRAFGAAGLHDRIVRLSCAVDENALLASGARNSKRMFVASSYFASLPTEANAAFKEVYYGLHGDQAPVLNALGQSTYEGVHFLAGLLQEQPRTWQNKSHGAIPPVIHRSARQRQGTARPNRAQIYLARADGLKFEVINSF